MLKFTKEGIIYGDKIYKISAADMNWIKVENKKNPQLHPARDLRSLAHTIEELN